MAEQVTININNGVALLTLNNPPLNLATLASTRQLNAALDDLAVDRAEPLPEDAEELGQDGD